MQLSLFDNNHDDNQELPLPLLVAQKWGFNLAYHIVGDDYLYAVQDWIAGLINMSNKEASGLWRKMDKIQSRNSIHTLNYIASDGKNYQRPYVNDKCLYDIAAHMRATKNRPVLAEVKNYLANAGVWADSQRLNPELGISPAIGKYEKQGKSPAWIEARIKGMWARKQFTAALQNSVIDLKPSTTYKDATEIEYLYLLEHTTKQLRSNLDITIKQNPRDHMSMYAIMYLGIVEAVVSEKIGDNEYVTEAMAFEIIRTVATMIKKQAMETANALGIDLITGKKLLDG